VLGANDGIVSTASLVLGVAAAGASGRTIVTAGIAGLMAGGLSMAAGGDAAVGSQRVRPCPLTLFRPAAGARCR